MHDEPIVGGLFGPFKLIRRLAVGGTAEVFLAAPRRGDRPAPKLVIKRPLDGLAQAGDFEALEREASLHSAIVDPHVVRVFGAGMVDETPYLAMEYIDGVDAFRLMRAKRAEQRLLPIELAVFIARRVARALLAVHTASDKNGRPLAIVHRDVSPSNIYLGLNGEVKLGDFGIARFSSSEAEITGTLGGLKGKFGYLAPEQIAGEPFDGRADLFSLGVVLGELLIGERVFPGSGQLAVLLAIRDGNIAPLRAARDRLPPGLFEICEHALEPDPLRRFESGDAFDAALAPFERSPTRELERELGQLVAWASDSARLAKQLQGRIRDSVQRMRAVLDSEPQPDSISPPSTEAARAGIPTLRPRASKRPTDAPSHFRTSDGRIERDVPFPRLLELVATGQLKPEDEVALFGAEFTPIRQIAELARHLLPSTTKTTARMFGPGSPNLLTSVPETPLLKLLAKLRCQRATGALFVTRSTGQQHQQRKEVYIRDGVLLHVASTERDELLGEYLVRRGTLSRAGLEHALNVIRDYGGHLGDTLADLNLVDATALFRAIRNQGRDRVAGLFRWPVADLAFYEQTEPGTVQFPLQLDLATAMMAGCLADAAEVLPDGAGIQPGARAAQTTERRERGTAPRSLQWLARHSEELAIVGRVRQARQTDAQLQTTSDAELDAALRVAHELSWIAIEGLPRAEVD